MDIFVNLFKKNGKNTRYYQIFVYLNLFGEYIVERKYGNITFKHYTGQKNNFFTTKKEAYAYAEKILKQKVKKGYYEKFNYC